MASPPPLEFPSEFFPSYLFDYEDTKVTQPQNVASIAVFLTGLVLLVLALGRVFRATLTLWPYLLQYVSPAPSTPSL